MFNLPDAISAALLNGYQCNEVKHQFQGGTRFLPQASELFRLIERGGTDCMHQRPCIIMRVLCCPLRTWSGSHPDAPTRLLRETLTDISDLIMTFDSHICGFCLILDLGICNVLTGLKLRMTTYREQGPCSISYHPIAMVDVYSRTYPMENENDYTIEGYIMQERLL